MFDHLLQEIINVDRTRLNEVFASSATGLATPDPRPLRSEVTVFDWLDRIEKWGKVAYYHKDPENFWGKRKINRKQFVDRLTDEELNKMFGRWQIKKKGLTKCIIRREYVNFKGKKYTEQFIVDIRIK